jgi:hypothetical protein
MKHDLVLAIAVLALVSASAASAAHFDTINVVTAGLVCDGKTDTSAQFQALLNAHGNDTIYYFPSRWCAIRNVNVTNAKNVTFYSDAKETGGLQYKEPPSSYHFMMTFTGCSNITFRDIGINNKHISTYGGLRFYESAHVSFQRVKVYDSLPKSPLTTDKYGIVFGHGNAVSRDILVEDSEFYGLQLEIDHAHNVVVQNNTFYNAVGTTAVGSFSIGDNSEAINHLYQNNVIINPSRCGICLNLDPPTTNYTQWRNIRIVNNVIQRRGNGRYNIRLGTGDTSKKVVGTVFDTIYADGNRVYYVGVPPDQPVVTLSGRTTYGITFTTTTITPNNFLFH